MKTEKNILIAFILNLSFAIFEFFGGVFTGSVAIISDAIHDVGDATSIGISYFLEKQSRKKPDEKYTYGYVRYSVIGSVITTLILLVGSVIVIINAVDKMLNPTKINYKGMIVFAVLGLVVNFVAAIVTHGEGSLNQKAVNLHMLEDVLGWAVVLIGAVIMNFTDVKIIDPLMSIGVSVFIFVNAFKSLKEVLDLFLEKTPHGIKIDEIKAHILNIDGLEDVHHIHIWSLDGVSNFATMHIVTNCEGHEIKEKVREKLSEHGISHATLELETVGEHCHESDCNAHINKNSGHGHHHHHHHH